MEEKEHLCVPGSIYKLNLPVSCAAAAIFSMLVAKKGR